jgi:glycosyltransferase 2 family protein
MWKTLLKIAISVATIIIVFHEINLQTFIEQLLRIKISWFMLAIAIQILSAIIAAWKWEKIMSFMGYHPRLKFYIQSYFIGTLFNQALPTSVGGDAVRIADAHKLGAGLRKAFYGVMVDRYYGTVGLTVLNIFPIFWLHQRFPNHIFYLIVVIIVLVSGGLLAALLIGKIHFLNRFKLTRLFYELSQAIVSNAHSLPRISLLLVLGILANLLTIIAIQFIAISLGIQVSLLQLMAVIPAVTLITLLPISFAGWGIREGAMITFLLFLHIPKTAILSLSVLYGVMLILASLPGLYFYLFRRKHPLHEASLS